MSKPLTRRDVLMLLDELLGPGLGAGMPRIDLEPESDMPHHPLTGNFRRWAVDHYELQERIAEMLSEGEGG